MNKIGVCRERSCAPYKPQFRILFENRGCAGLSHEHKPHLVNNYRLKNQLKAKEPDPVVLWILMAMRDSPRRLDGMVNRMVRFPPDPVLKLVTLTPFFARVPKRPIKTLKVS